MGSWTSNLRSTLVYFGETKDSIPLEYTIRHKSHAMVGKDID
ncbi:MAG: hypothetical protein ACW99A_12820 [Candidatus Kariarchaeaceae archaeon]